MDTQGVDILCNPHARAQLSISIARGRLKAALADLERHSEKCRADLERHSGCSGLTAHRQCDSHWRAHNRQAGQIQGALDDLERISAHIQEAAAQKRPRSEPPRPISYLRHPPSHI